jgi:molybdopterin/thiamine biosynthesis adenylyltransferase
MTPPSDWSYEDAFIRNQGLISPAEQAKLRRTRIAIAGMGGVGGVHLATLARLGIGAFTIADPDVYETANINRQYGASAQTLGRPKVEVMAEIARGINPEIDLRLFCEPIGKENVDDFLQGADLFVDAIEFFEIDARRVIFRKAAERGIYAVSAGPVGFGTVWQIFDPTGMPFDRYFDFSDGMDATEKMIAFGLGVAPRLLQIPYMPKETVRLDRRIAPSSSGACQLAAGVLAIESVKILLGRGRIYPIPYYHQFDAYRGRFLRKKLRGGNRHPLQRLKRWWLANYFRRQSAGETPQGTQ